APGTTIGRTPRVWYPLDPTPSQAPKRAPTAGRPSPVTGQITCQNRADISLVNNIPRNRGLAALLEGSECADDHGRVFLTVQETGCGTYLCSVRVYRPMAAARE